MGDERPLATTEQVAAYLGVPDRTLDTWAHRGTGPRFARVGRYRRYKWVDVDRWLESQARTTGRTA